MAYQPKSYRKFVATAATATLVAGAIAPLASAASFTDVAPKYKDAVDFVVSKGVKGLTDTQFGVSENIKRVDAAVMLVKVLGLDTEKAPASGFTDVPARAEKEVNALKAAGITSGKTATQFGANDLITRGELAVWIQKGFELKGSSEVTFTDVPQQYKEAVSALVGNKVTSGINETQFGTNNNAKRGDFAIFLHKADSVVAPPVVVDPVVESVSATNNKEIVVTFNKAINEDTAKDITNYKLTTVTSGGAATIESAKLQADGKTVVITLGTTAKNQETYKLEVKNVKDTAGVAIEKTEKEVKFFDVTAPTAESVEVVAPRTVKINFSEPMATAPTVKLDNGSISTTVTLAADKKSAQVEFGIEPTIGKHELEIQGGADFATLKVDKVVKAFEYQKDTTAPTVSVEKADAKTVTLKFSKPVSVKTAKDVTVYHTVNNSNPYAGTLTATNMINGYSDTYKVSFETPLPEGAVKVFLNTKENALEDGWGNDVASTELSTNVVVDKAAPVVTEVKAVKDNKLEVTFDEEVNKADAEKLSNYILKDASGKVLSDKDYDFVNAKGEFLSSKVTVSYDKKKATITLSKPLAGGNYSLTVKEIKDVSYLENKLTSQDISLVVTDTTPWNITTDALRTGDKIRVTFNEAMSTEGLTDLAKYELRNANGKVEFPKDTKLVVLNSKAVEIQLGSNVSASSLRVSGTLKDASGNTFNELYKEVAISSDNGPALVTDTAKTVATNKVQFEVNQELSGSLNPADFTTTGVVYGGASYVNKDGKSTITLTVKDDSTKFVTDATPTVTVAKDALVSIYGAKNQSLTINAADGIAPSVAKDNAGKLVIGDIASTVAADFTITFDEALYDGGQYETLAANDLVIDVEGKTLVAGVDFTTEINGKVLTVDLLGKYKNHVGNLSVATKEKPVYIKDAAVVGNVANTFAATTVTVTSASDVLAAVEKAEASKLQNDVIAAKALVVALPDGADKTELLKRLDAVTAPVISDVKIKSSNANPAQATDGDTITLTFKSDKVVTPLSSFKFNGSNVNPTTEFKNNGDGTYTVTHLVDAGDKVGAVTFQINVTTEKGIYSQTVEATTDGSAVAITR